MFNLYSILKKLYENQKIAPFETMFGFICIYGGIAGLFNYGIVNNIFTSVFSSGFLILFNSIYLLSGFAIFFGITFKRGNIEAFGLVILATTLIARTLIFGWLLGVNPVIINAYISNAAFVFACLVRLRIIIRNNKIIERHGNGTKMLMI